MKIKSLKDYTGGWIVGSFTPALLKKSDIEVGVKYLKKGFVDDAHYHSNSTEYNVLISGKLSQGKQIITKGDIFIFAPKDIAQVSVLEDAIVLVIRDGCAIGDKILVEQIL